MSSCSVLESHHIRTREHGIDKAVRDSVDEHSAIALDLLVTLLPDYTWSEIFHAVDRLARKGEIRLRRHNGDYTLFSTDYAG